MDYQTVANFSESWGLAFLMVMFAIAVLYALWPSNKDKFDKAAQLPLQDDVENTP